MWILPIGRRLAQNPEPLKSDRLNHGAALTIPLRVTGTPKELDEQLPRQLVEFVETHLGLSSTLKSSKEQMEAAAKAAREAAETAQVLGLSRASREKLVRMAELAVSRTRSRRGKAGSNGARTISRRARKRR